MIPLDYMTNMAEILASVKGGSEKMRRNEREGSVMNQLYKIFQS